NGTLDPRPQCGWLLFAHDLVLHCTAQCSDGVALARQCRVGRQPSLDRKHAGWIKLTVVVGVDEQSELVGFARRQLVRRHDASEPTVSIKRRRARASRDITVPTGTPVISAMSR